MGNATSLALDESGYHSGATKGAAAELLVAARLMANGFQVFRNLSPNGIDLLALKGGQVLRIEVKSALKWSADGSKMHHPHVDWSQIDVLAVVDNLGEIVLLPHQPPA